MKLKHPPGKPLPPKFTTGIECDFVRAFTWKERFQILVGYTAMIRLRIATQHSPGQFQPFMDLTLTETLMPETQITK